MRIFWYNIIKVKLDTKGKDLIKWINRYQF